MKAFCNKNIIIPSSIVPTPIIHFNRDSNSTILFTGNDFVLTANIEPLDSSVDTLISFDSMWYKKSYLIEENMTVSEMNSNQTYNTSIYFTPLKSNDSGTYLVHVIVNSEESEYVHGSSANASINIPLSKYATQYNYIRFFICRNISTPFHFDKYNYISYVNIQIVL